MCLGVPGQVSEIDSDPFGMTMGKVSFGGVTKRVCLAYTPEAEVGDYVVVHVGFAISRIDEDEARKVFETLRELGELAELDIPQPTEPEHEGRAEASLSRPRGFASRCPEGGRGIEGEGGGAMELDRGRRGVMR